MEDFNQHVRALVVETKYEGSCNACARKSEPKVVMVDLRNCSFRVCLDCARELKLGLRSAIKTLESCK